MTIYNHVFALNFSVDSEKEDASDVTGAMIRQRIIKRLQEADDNELLESVENCNDTIKYEEQPYA